MPRQVQIVTPRGQSELLLTKLTGIHGVMGTRLQRGASQHPPGDVLTIDVLNRGLPEVCRVLADEGVGADESSSFSTSEPKSLIQSSASEAIARDSSEMSWEEIESAIGHQSNMTVNAMTVMFVSGVIATVGIATNALHVVLGAMLIAPGFLPLVRVSLGIVAQSPAWRRGLVDLIKGYAAVAAGAASATLLLIGMGKQPLGEEASYLPAGTLISYWMSITGTSVVVSLVAGVVGAILLATGRSVLTAGVMVALALVPGASLVGMGAVTGNLDVMTGGALRWVADVATVIITSLLVLLWKRASVHKRAMMP